MSIINTNMQSINAQRHIQVSNREQATAMERLSSGSRINRAADDAAGLTIVEHMNSQVNGLTQAIRNSNDGISLLQVADGAMDSISNLIQRMRELSVQAASGTYTDDNREDIQVEFSALQNEITRVIGTSSFNGISILNRDPDATQTTIDFQIGWNATGEAASSASFMGEGVTPETTITGVSGTQTDGKFGDPGFLTGSALGATPGLATDNKTVHNDQTFKLKIDGTETNDITISAGTYTKAEWATELENAINADTNLITAGASVSVAYSADDDNYVITSSSENTSTTATSKVEWGTTSPGSLSELGLTSASTATSSAAEVKGKFESSDISGAAGTNVGITLPEKVAFSINVDGTDHGPIELAAATKTKSAWATEIQTQLRAATGGTETVAYDSTNDIYTITSTGGSGPTSVISVTQADEGMALFGFTSTFESSISLAGEAASNRELSITVDGGEPTTITLPEESKTTAEWASYIESQISGIDITFDDTNNQFTITSATTGRSSSIAVTGDVSKLGLTTAGTTTAGSDGDQNQIRMTHYDLDDTTNALGAILLSTEQLDSQENSTNMLSKLDDAIGFVSNVRAHFGAIQNRLTHTVDNLRNMHENSSAARSQIQDADFATESAEMARLNVLKQAGMAMLSQANQAPQQTLKLLQ